VSTTGSGDLPRDVEVRARRRIRWLVIANVALGFAAPLALNFLPPAPWWFKAASAIAIGQYMLLPCWVGLGIAGADRRWLPLMGGAVYLAVVQSMFVWIRSRSVPVGGVLVWLGVLSIINLVIVSVLALIVAAFRTKLASLRLFADPAPLDAASRWQLSLRELFIITLAAAVLLGLARYARVSDPTGPPVVLFMCLYWSVLATTALCAVWAALAPGRIRWRVAGVFVASLFLGAVMSMARSFPDVASQIVNAFDLVPATAVVIASLLVVRSCGYRLVARDDAPRTSREPDHPSPLMGEGGS
jgi:hypothetical protein